MTNNIQRAQQQKMGVSLILQVMYRQNRNLLFAPDSYGDEI